MNPSGGRRLFLSLLLNIKGQVNELFVCRHSKPMEILLYLLRVSQSEGLCGEYIFVWSAGEEEKLSSVNSCGMLCLSRRISYRKRTQINNAPTDANRESIFYAAVKVPIRRHKRHKQDGREGSDWSSGFWTNRFRSKEEFVRTYENRRRKRLSGHVDLSEWASRLSDANAFLRTCRPKNPRETVRCDLFSTVNYFWTFPEEKILRGIPPATPTEFPSSRQTVNTVSTSS